MKDDLVYVGHMLDTARRVLRLIAGQSRETFERDETLSLAITHLLQTIGEAARRVSPEFATAHPEIPWRAIVGMRHRVVHDYMFVDLEVVWDVANRDMAGLVKGLEKLVDYPIDGGRPV